MMKLLVFLYHLRILLNNDLEGKKFYNIEQLYQSNYEKYSNVF